jgi:cytochrome c oxidase subunit 2
MGVSMVKALFMMLFLINVSFAAEPFPWQIGMQEPVTDIMSKIVDLHNHLLLIIFPIGLFVTVLIAYVAWKFRASKNPVASKTTHHTILEIVWTAIPTLILFVICFPSIKLVYFADKVPDSSMTVKVIGLQWYWQYQYPDDKIEFESRMIADKDIQPGQKRLLDVDHQVVIPVNTNVRLLVTAGAEDVIHSWSVPAFGIKQDAVPGRIREVWINVKKEGVYYGQCSEICGSGHAYMPIVVRVVSKGDYAKWLSEAKQKFAGALNNSNLVVASL